MPYRPGEIVVLKVPSAAVFVSRMTFLAPSRTRTTSAPARGFPLVSFTEPVIVASVPFFGGVAGVPSTAMADNTMRDKLKPIALFIAADLRARTAEHDPFHPGALLFWSIQPGKKSQMVHPFSPRQNLYPGKRPNWFRSETLP